MLLADCLHSTGRPLFGWQPSERKDGRDRWRLRPLRDRCLDCGACIDTASRERRQFDGTASVSPSASRRVRRENTMRLSFRLTRQSSVNDSQNETDHSATFRSAFYDHAMRSSLSCLNLCLFCCAFAQGVGPTRAVQSALLRPPDAVSTVDGSPPRASSHLLSCAVWRFRQNGR